MTQTTDIINREHWLESAVEKLRPYMKSKGYTVPGKIRIACSWPTGRSRPNKKGTVTLGECHACESSADKSNQITITMSLEDPLRILDVVLHELGHAAVGVKYGHKAPFARFCKAVGLDGEVEINGEKRKCKPTATVPNDTLKAILKEIADELGPYPHAALSAGQGKKQTTRLIKCICPKCEYTARITTMWIEQGLPVCDTCGEQFIEAGSEESIENPLKVAEQVFFYDLKPPKGRKPLVKPSTEGLSSEQIEIALDAFHASVAKRKLEDERFQIKLTKKNKEQSWAILDHDANGTGTSRLTPVFSREEAIDLIDSIREDDTFYDQIVEDEEEEFTGLTFEDEDTDYSTETADELEEILGDMDESEDEYIDHPDVAPLREDEVDEYPAYKPDAIAA